ncbi:MAG: hypothetical protein WDN49_16085 [Acetobacteraceae bacterium]
MAAASTPAARGGSGTVSASGAGGVGAVAAATGGAVSGLGWAASGAFGAPRATDGAGAGCALWVDAVAVEAPWNTSDTSVVAVVSCCCVPFDSEVSRNAARSSACNTSEPTIMVRSRRRSLLQPDMLRHADPAGSI